MTISSFRSFTLAILVAILVWSSATHNSCNATRSGRHWRKNRSTSTTLSKKKSGNNHHNGGGGKSKSKSSSHKAPPASAPAPPEHDDGGVPAAANTYNVLNFGAKGDGIADDTKVKYSISMISSDFNKFLHQICHCFSSNCWRN